MLRLDEPSNLTPTALLGSLTIHLSCGKAILSFKEVVDSKGRAGEGEVAGKTALPTLRYPAHLEERRNCLCSAHHNLRLFQSPLSVYKHFWRLLKGNRSQGVKEISIANHFVLRHQHRSSWDYPWKIIHVGLWRGRFYWNLSYRGGFLHASSTSSGVCMHLSVWNVFRLSGAARMVKQDSYNPVSQQAAPAAM